MMVVPTMTEGTCEVPTESGSSITFRGRVIGSASTHEPSKLRWFKIRIYWNDDTTSYTVSKIGRSVVYHRPSCGSLRTPTEERVAVDEPPSDAWEPCPTCEPDLDFDPVVLEKDRVTLNEGLLAIEVPEVLRQRDDDTGEWFLSNAARTALREATDNDEELMRVYAPRRARRLGA
jgi:hypothetical protein